MLGVYDHGIKIATHYDKPGDPKSIEATVMINVANPLGNPKIHKNIPGGAEHLEVYRQEVVEGIHDHWINPQEKKWTYTYHERLFNWNPSVDLNAKNRGLMLPEGVDQIELVVKDLERDITSKGAQATTWIPSADPLLESNRPCLQRLWFRALENNEGDVVLNLNSHWRSRDLAKAWFMNSYAITDLQGKVAEDLSKRIGKEVKVGSYKDVSDSLHIYGNYLEEYKGHIKNMKERPMDGRVFVEGTPMWEGFVDTIIETQEKLIKDPDYNKCKN